MKRLKYILILLTVLFFTECKNKSGDKAKIAESRNKIDTTEITPKHNQSKFKRNELIKITDDKKFSLSDFSKIKFVWKGAKNLNELEKIEYKRERNKALDPFENENTVSLMTGYKEEVIPNRYKGISVLLLMRFHGNEMYTIWEENQDSFKFTKFLKPVQNGRYGSSLIDSVFEIQGKTIVSGMTLGGEGGDTWNSFWVKQVKNDRIIELENTPIVFNLHSESQEYLIEYNYPNIRRTILRDSVGKFKDTIILTLNVNQLIENGL